MSDLAVEVEGYDVRSINRHSSYLGYNAGAHSLRLGNWARYIASMLIAALIILAAAALLGAAIAVMHLQTLRATIPSWPLATLHGILAIGGLSCLAIALRGPARGLDQGTASFRLIAITMMMLAALPGAGLLAARIRKRRIAGIMMGIHATIAVSGIAFLAAYVFAG